VALYPDRVPRDRPGRPLRNSDRSSAGLAPAPVPHAAYSSEGHDAP